jgi:hypothetical protein
MSETNETDSDHRGATGVSVPRQDLEDLRHLAQELLRQAGLDRLLAEIAPGPYGTTIDNLRLLGALELGLACLKAARRALVGRIQADRRAGFAGGSLAPEEQRFCSLMAVHVGLCEALAALELEQGQLPPPGRHLKLEEYRGLLCIPQEEELVPALLSDLQSYLEFYRGHPSEALRLAGPERLLACAGSYLALVSQTAERLGDDGEYAPTLEALREVGLSINGAEYRAFERQTALPLEEERDLMSVAAEDIVGNEEVLKAGMALARTVAGFDLERGVNPQPIRNPVLFMLGAPGCGKTVTAHAIGNAFLDLCARHKIPARFRIIRRTDWASHYQNKSANELLRIFRQEIFEFPGVAGAYWPDIDTAFAARDDPGIRAEEKAILGTLFGLLDGTVGPRNGKWFLIADANYLTMDKAALSRLTQDPHYATGPQSAEHFVELLRDKKLGKVKSSLVLTEAEWQDFGQRCVEAKLSGRAVDNIAGKLLTEVARVELPDAYFSMSYEEKLELLEGTRREVSHPEICELLERYIRFEREAEERAREERFERRVTEIRERLAAQVAAVSVEGT